MTLFSERTGNRMKSKQWYLFVVRCSDKSLYASFSQNVSRTMDAYASPAHCPRNLRSKTPVILLGYVEVEARGDAVRESRVFNHLPDDEREAEWERWKSTRPFQLPL